ncbi:holo-ACP synthase [Microbacterium sp. NPDC087592]|uniref:holo-ACP synthase n=1 Tax=Microbacterium sp. NPDC087592 TaxID=3364193 RepID=UPI00382322F2
MIRIGVDVSSPSALERRAKRSRADFIRRFWTGDEISDARGRYQLLASQWSVKEATMKALGVGIGKIDPLDIETLHVGTVPALRLHRSAEAVATTLQLTQWNISVAREDNWVVAFVLGTGGGSDGDVSGSNA